MVITHVGLKSYGCKSEGMINNDTKLAPLMWETDDIRNIHPSIFYPAWSWSQLSLGEKRVYSVFIALCSVHLCHHREKCKTVKIDFEG